MPTLTGFAFGTSAPQANPNIPVFPDTSGNYTLPGALLQTFTVSGTYTPGAGITRVDVVVIGGGGSGSWGGGSGGGVRTYRSVPVSGPVTVTVGGAGTATTFGTLSAPGGISGESPWGARSPNPLASAGGGGANSGAQNGQAGITVNGTSYAGGGGGGGDNNIMNPVTASGGAGGGGAGRAYTGDPGGAGFGGGGGGGRGGGGGLGGSGRVMIYGVV